MKPLNNLTNTDKAKLLHELFPEEIPKVLDIVQKTCKDILRNKEHFKRMEWDFGVMPLETWVSVCGQLEPIVDRLRFELEKSSQVFADQLFQSETAWFVEERIHTYTLDMSRNIKFNLAVSLLYE